MSLRDLLAVGFAWREARRLDRLPDRAALVAHQQRRLAVLLAHVADRSPHYSPFAGRPLADWPLMDKQRWMDGFDAINTVGARLAPLLRAALADETARRFDATFGDCSVGLSTGTSGVRGLFLVSRAERNRWAGTMLAKLLRGGPWRRERVALLLRAGNSLYRRVGAGRLEFRYIDPLAPWPTVLGALREFAPTILVAPAQALSLLAAEPAGARPAPARVISCAEVLQDLDRERIERAFERRVEQIYQATEGFLGATCAAGTLHLNEAQYHIEKEWCAADPERFVPIVTDLYRTTQPVIRYRLNDLLRIRREPCACGNVATALAAIDGRCDDALALAGRGAERVTVFPDLLSRAILNAAPGIADFEVEELRAGDWRIGLEPAPDESIRDAVRAALATLADRLGAQSPALEFSPVHPRTLAHKLRRVRARAP
jgi:putative adenylate-forming enzyme